MAMIDHVFDRIGRWIGARLETPASEYGPSVLRCSPRRSSVRYPILPTVERGPGQEVSVSSCGEVEILHIRHHSLSAPRDFDLSQNFEIVKPSLDSDFDFHRLKWTAVDDAHGLQHADSNSANS